MTYKTVKLGDYITQIKDRNKDLLVDNPIGISSDKSFRRTTANRASSDFSTHKIIRKGQFGCDLLNTIRTDRFAIALLTEIDIATVSPAYYVFKINDENRLLPDYLMLYMRRLELDRQILFWTDSSVRGEVKWERFIELEIPLPPIEKQREYVAIYGNLLKLASNHEKSFADLQLISDTYIEQLANKYGTEELGQYIQPTDTRNRDNSLGKKELRGISTSKVFIQSKANTAGVSFTNYKIVQNGQFAYVSDTSRRGDKIALAFNEHSPIIISSIYTTFEIVDINKILPEFLLLWFKRSEFDRYARYNSWGSARETFDWSEMRRVRVPVPPVEVQRSIVAIYHALESRKKLTERLKNIIKDISPVLIKDAKDRVLATAKI